VNCNRGVLSTVLMTLPILIAGATPKMSASTTASLPAVLPLRGIYYSAEDIGRARADLGREKWRRTLADQITSSADDWLRHDDQWYRDILPKPGSLFSYGIDGCPACHEQWYRFGRDNCSFDKPGQVRCPKCGRVFPDPDPKSPYHDAGRGVMVDGKRYFLCGVWNAYVCESLITAYSGGHPAISALAHAYALTGRDEYARKAIVILDALATLSPTTRGPRDFDRSGNLESSQGRLHFLTSFVQRRIMSYALWYDILGRHAMLRDDSPTSPGRSMAENIRLGLFEDYLFAHFDVRGGKLATLHNHEADCVRAMLATGLVYDNPDYVRWGIDEGRTLVANTIDRDGMYYEVSPSYGRFTATVLIDIAELCANYDPAKYADTSRSFPPAYDFFANPKMVRFLVDNNDLTIAGHEMNFGNGHQDHSVVLRPGGEPNGTHLLSKVFLYVRDAGLRKRAQDMLGQEMAGKSYGGFTNPWWLMKMPAPLPKPAKARREQSGVGASRFFSTKALAAFQSGQWPDRRGFCIRGGPPMPHAHDDQLGLNLYDLGRDLSAEIGYAVFGSHLHKGWGTRALSHNLVVVDHDAAWDEEHQLVKFSAGADWRSFYDGGIVRFTDADASAQFRPRVNVTKYRRRFAAVDINTSASYYVDVFDVAGGSVRDYSLHAPYNDELLTSALEIEGTAIAPVKGAWTLAGLNPEWRNAEWNAPGKSWGERVIPGDYLRKLSPDDEVGPYGWQPPGRAYGFLYNLRGAEKPGPFSATWKIDGDDRAALRATFLAPSSARGYFANAPDLTGQHVFNYVVCRDEATSASRFVVVLEPRRGERLVQGIELLQGAEGGPLAIRVQLADGRTDLLMMGDSADDVAGCDSGAPGIRVTARGEFAFSRLDRTGKPTDASMFRARQLSVGRKVLLESRGCIEGTVTDVEPGSGRLRVRLNVPEAVGIAPEARFAVLSSPEYVRNTALELRPGAVSKSSGREIIVDVGDVAVQKARVDETAGDGATTSSIPLVFAAWGAGLTHALDGKQLAPPDGAGIGRIRECLNLKGFVARDLARPLRKGEDLDVRDFAVGDRVELPLGAPWPERGVRHESAVR
jgi:hypothetical protein